MTEVLLFVLAYGVSVVVAIPFTFGWSWLLHYLIEQGNVPAAKRIKWIPLLIGILERAVITTLVGWAISGAAAFIVGWMALKTVGDWEGMKSGTPDGRARFFVGLLGSLMSVIFGVIGRASC